MTTEGTGTSGLDVEAQPLINDGNNNLGEWSRHNDKELSNQRNVLNLNNRHIRLTLWCFVYIILTTLQINTNTFNYYWFDDEWWDEWDQDYADKQMEYYQLGISANTITFWAVAILLCSWYCICCKASCNYCTAFLFVVGSVMLFATMIDGSTKDCERNELNEELKGYCRALYTGSSIFVACFTLYLAVDVVKSVGDDIRIRLVVKSLLVAVRSFLLFVYWNKEVNDYMDSDWDYTEVEFHFRTSAGGNLLTAIVCCFVILIVAFRFGNYDQELHPFIPRLFGFLLLSAMGSTLLMYTIPLFGFSLLSAMQAWIQKSFYFVVACVLIVYDLQYL